MRNKRILKGFIVLIIGLIILSGTLIINDYIESDLLCFIIMILSLILEIYGLKIIIEEKRYK